MVPIVRKGNYHSTDIRPERKYTEWDKVGVLGRFIQNHGGRRVALSSPSLCTSSGRSERVSVLYLDSELCATTLRAHDWEQT